MSGGPEHKGGGEPSPFLAGLLWMFMIIFAFGDHAGHTFINFMFGGGGDKH